MLENILHDYFGLQENWNDEYSKQAENWYNAYDKLVKLIYELDKLGVIDNSNKVVDKLDKIDSME
jgi:hypothetical protein